MDPKPKLPLLPLRDIVVFPNMVIPLFVGRDKSITALNEVMKGDKKIILVTQKNSEIDDPKKNDIYLYGCESNILQLLKLPDGTVKVLVEGTKRLKINEFIDDEKFTDKKSFTIGVAACDIDSDGYEEIYFLNTDTYSGEKRYSDRLLDQKNKKFFDIFEQKKNQSDLNFTAGRSVVCVDRKGNGKFGNVSIACTSFANAP